MPEQPPEDDKSISSETRLWRRIPLDPMHVIFDENLGRWRPTSAAFEDNRDGTFMSVTMDRGQPPADALAALDSFALASITVGLVRENKLGVIPVPLPVDKHHAEVTGHKTHKIRSKLAKAADWVIPPPQTAQP